MRMQTANLHLWLYRWITQTGVSFSLELALCYSPVKSSKGKPFLKSAFAAHYCFLLENSCKRFRDDAGIMGLENRPRSVGGDSPSAQRCLWKKRAVEREQGSAAAMHVI